MVYVYKKNDRETAESLIKRFTRRIQQSRVLMDLRGKRFQTDDLSKTKRRRTALYNKKMKKEVDKLKKIGRFTPDAFNELKLKVKKEI